MFNHFFRSLLLFFLIPGSFAFTADIASKETLIVRGTHQPPYSYRTEKILGYRDENKPVWGGMSIEIVRAVVDRAGYNLELVAVPRKRAFTMMKSGEMDIMFNLTPTEARKVFLDFVGLSSYEQMALVVRKEDESSVINSLDDFITYNKLLGIRESYHYPVLSERLKTDKALAKQISVYPVNRGGVSQLKRGVIFGFFEDKNYFAYKIKHDAKVQGLALHNLTLGEPIEVHIAVSLKTNREIRDNLRDAHRALTEEGVIDGIIERWEQQLIN